MRCWLLLIVALAFTSCNLFKNTHSLIKDAHQEVSTATDLKLHEDKNWLSTSGTLTWRKDSSKLNYAVKVWPKGNFTFSPEHGFSGEAEKVLMTGSAESGATTLNQTSNQTADKGKVDIDIGEKGEVVLDQQAKTKMSSPSWKWVIGGVVVLLLLGATAYFKFKPLKII